jgi:putative ABC transport system ATP-binding protein
MALMQKLNAKGMTIVMVTHEPDIANFANRIITFRDGAVISDVSNQPDDANNKLAALENAVP